MLNSVIYCNVSTVILLKYQVKYKKYRFNLKFFQIALKRKQKKIYVPSK